ncbi:choice-of-anchor D domain-containing protein [Candidatus Latescibacterota bacterium]
MKKVLLVATCLLLCFGLTAAVIAQTTISIDDVERDENEDGATTVFTFTVTIADTQPFDVTFNYETQDGTTPDYAATTADGDYEEITTTQGQIDAGAENTTIPVTVYDDDKYELDEIFTVKLTNLSTIDVTFADDEGVGTITNDDSLPTVTLDGTSLPLNEDSSVGYLNASLSNTSYQDVIVTVGFTGTAAYNSDYMASDTQITVTSGLLDSDSENNITLSSTYDTLDEYDETIIMDITNVTNGTEDGIQQLTTNLIDNDDPPLVTLIIDTDTVTFDEAPSYNYTFVGVRLSTNSGKTVTGDFAFSGTADIEDDYTVTNTSFSLTPGPTEYWIGINSVNDDWYEGETNETVIVDIENLVDCTEDTPQQVTGYIVDNETPPDMSVTGNEIEITEGYNTPNPEDGTDFGDMNVYNGSITHTFTIINSGTGLLDFTGDPLAYITGTHADDFEVTVYPTGPIGYEETTTFEVTFNPSAAGIRQAIVNIPNNDASTGNSFDFNIEGNGTNPGMLVTYNGVTVADGDNTPTAEKGTDFGEALVTAEETVERTFYIYNTGDGDLLLTGEPYVSVVDDNDFWVSAQPVSSTIAAGDSLSFSITFGPDERGLLSAAVVSINNIGGEDTYNFDIEGTGIAPIMEVYYLGTEGPVPVPNWSEEISEENGTWFGLQEINTGSATHTFMIYNDGTADLHLIGDFPVIIQIIPDKTTVIEIADPFTVTAQPAVSTIAPDDTTTFTVTFDPDYDIEYINAVGIYNDGLFEPPVEKKAQISVVEPTYAYLIGGMGITAPEIDVRGGRVTIQNGDETPSTGDRTNFGSVVLGTSVTNTYTIANLGSEYLYLGGPDKVAPKAARAEPDDMMVIVNIDNEFNEDFMVTVQPDWEVPPDGYTTSFDVTFTPSGLGLRQAYVYFYNNDGDEGFFEFMIQGTGSSGAVGALTVLAPNGGETWASGSSQFVVWDSGPGVGMIEASVDGGATWTLVAEDVNLANGSYPVTVSELSSTDCLVRITTTDGTELSDTSDATFTIEGTSPVTVTGIKIKPLEGAAKGAAVATENQYQVLVDLTVTGTVQDMRIVAYVESGETSYAVEEWYGSYDADLDIDIDEMTGTVFDVPVGTVIIPPPVGTLTAGVSMIIVGESSYTGSDIAYEDEEVVLPEEPITTAEALPTEFSVTGFYPNPFNPLTTIGYSVPEDCRVTLTVYDITGRRVAVLVDRLVTAGTYSVVWDARDETGARLSSGLYLYNLTAGSFRAQGKVILLK